MTAFLLSIALAQTIVSSPVAAPRVFVQPVRDEPAAREPASAIAARYLAHQGTQLGSDGFELRQLPVRPTHLGSWVPFALLRDGLPVLGATINVHVDTDGRVDRVAGRRASREVQGEFRLDPRAALLAAAGRGPRWGLVDPSVERNPGTVGRALVDDGTVLRPVFLVYPRSWHPLERYQVIVDAESGAVRGSRNRVVFASDSACANVFNPTPGGSLNDSEPVQTILPFGYANDRDHLQGTYFETFNCCRNIECDPDGAESRYQDSIPNPIGIGADPIYFDTVTCDEFPKATAADGRFLFDPIDPPPGAASYGQALEDDFAEPTLYWSAQNLFSYMRQIGDPDFLLRAHGGTPALPDQPFHITANMVVPDYESAMTQILPFPLGQGRGTSDNPVVINDYARIDNAAYIPASTSDVFPVMIDLFNRDFDSIVLFQGEKRDYAYDGDVVMHEMTHAVMGTFNDLVAYTLDDQGSLASPGALGEGYSDYFAASLTNDSITGEYAGSGTTGVETGIRDAENDRVCPDDLTAEVHDDSWPWSGALWDLRDIFVGDGCDRATFDAAVFDAMVGLPAAPSFDQAAELVALALAQAYGRDSGAAQIATCIFKRRGMQECERVIRVLSTDGTTAVSTPFPQLTITGAGEVGTPVTAAELQVRVDVPRGATRTTLHWDEGGGGASVESMLGGAPTFNVLIKRGSPIAFSLASGTVVHDAETLLTVTRISGGMGQPALPQPVGHAISEPCGASYFYAFWNTGSSATVTNIRASVSVDSALAGTCTGALDLAPDPTRPEPTECSALPASIGDSEQCQFTMPHLPQACPTPDAGTVTPPPTDRDACNCAGGSAPALLPLLLAPLFGRWRARRCAG